MRTKLSTCTRKARFATEAEATAAAARSTLDLRPYRCDRCRRFHLTSRTRGKRTPRAAILNPPHSRRRTDWPGSRS